MTPCTCCGSTVIGQIIGMMECIPVQPEMQWDAIILWNCSCSTTRGLPWRLASEEQRIEALLVQATRDSRSEVMG